jgi:hypothetical protein
VRFIFVVSTNPPASHRSPVIEEIGAPNTGQVPRPEGTTTRSSFGDASNSGSDDGTDMQEGGSEAVDPRESSLSYVFGPSTITVGRIRQLASLGYFIEGATREPGEEIVSERIEDEAIVFEVFFIAGLRMPPQPVLANILVKFGVQLHQLTPNSFAQLSKYFWVVMSFSGVPSSDVFVKCYKLHYLPKKVEIDEGDMFQQFGYMNFHADVTRALEQSLLQLSRINCPVGGQGCGSTTKCLQMSACRGESPTHSALVFVWPGFSDGAPFQLH